MNLTQWFILNDRSNRRFDKNLLSVIGEQIQQGKHHPLRSDESERVPLEKRGTKNLSYESRHRFSASGQSVSPPWQGGVSAKGGRGGRNLFLSAH